METRSSCCRWCHCQARSNSSNSKFTISRSNVCKLNLFSLSNLRWVDQFTKLQLWKFTEYDRIVYMDSDLFPLINTEELFSIDLNQHSRTNLSFNYSFAAVPNLVGKSSDGSLNIGIGFNAGFFVLKPDVT